MGSKALRSGRRLTRRCSANVTPSSPLPQPQAPERAGSPAEVISPCRGPQVKHGVPGDSIFTLDREAGEQKLEQLARWLERDHPSASATPTRRPPRAPSRSTGSASRPRLRKCLGSTNLIDSTHSGVRQKTRRTSDQLEERSDGPCAGLDGLVRGDPEELPEDHRLRTLWMLRAVASSGP